MAQIPQDIMDAAEDVCEAIFDAVAGDKVMPVGGWRGETIRQIAAAILVERESCAQIAASYRSHGWAKDAAMCIENDIRSKALQE